MIEYLDDTKVYASIDERKQVAWELMSHAHMIYNRVYVFKNFDAFSRSFTDNPPEEYWEGMSYERLIDCIKICIAFEDYNKAILLLNGYVVHVIDRKKNQSLSEQQKIEPILISEFMMSNQFVQDENDASIYLEGFRDFNTISFAQTLKEGYQKIIGLDVDFLVFLKSISVKRNRLHYYKNHVEAFNLVVFLDQIRFAKDYGKQLIELELNKISI